MKMRRRKTLKRSSSLAMRSTVLLAGGLALAACGSSGHGAAVATTVVPTTAVSSTTAPTTASGTAGSGATTLPAPASTTSTTTPGPQACSTSDLTASIGSPNGAAGSTYYVLTFTNTSDASCVLSGYPGVSYVAGSAGTQIGAPAARLPGTVAAVTVQSGSSAFATVREVAAANYASSCGLTEVAGLRVYPPNETTALFVAQNSQGCSNSSDLVLQVGPIESTAAGASS